MGGWNEDFDCYVPYGYKLVPVDEVDGGPEPDKVAQQVALCNAIQAQHLAFNLVSSAAIAVTQVMFDEARKANSLEELVQKIKAARDAAMTEPDK